jgi:hypothetical protein
VYEEGEGQLSLNSRGLPDLKVGTRFALMTVMRCTDTSCNIATPKAASGTCGDYAES